MNTRTQKTLGRLVSASGLVALAHGAALPQLSFSPAVDVIANNAPTIRESVSADLTGDGNADVLMLGEIQGGELRLYVARGEGSRMFRPLELAPGTGTVGTLPILADVDGDGDIDLAAVDGVGGFVAFENDGTGAFNASTVAPNGYERAVALADADGDTDLDAFVQRATGEILVGTFDAATWTFDFNPAGVTAELETAVDLNGDGRADLVTIDSGIAVLPSVPGGYGAPIVVSSASPVIPNRVNVLVEDIDGDGNLDLSPVGVFGLSNQVYLGDGSLGFSTVAVLPTGLPDPPTGSQRFIHADTDGVLDLIYSANLDGDPFFSLTLTSLGVGALPFPAGSVPPLPPFDIDPEDLQAAYVDQASFQDIDGDGASDLLQGATVSYGPFAGSTFGFEDGVSIADFSAINGPSSVVHTVDVDGDGVLDVVSLSDTGQELLWSRGLGGFGFAAPEPLAAPTDGAFSFITGEWRAGEPPILVETRDDGTGPTVRVWRDTGTGLTPVGSISTLTPPLEAPPEVLGLADLNGDGIRDVVTSAGFHALTADAVPEARVSITGLDQSQITNYAFEDIDEDGDVDVLGWRRDGLGSLPLLLFRNLNSGQSFLQPVSLLPLGVPAAIVDIDGDGRLDIVLAQNQALTGLALAYRRGQGALSFGPPIQLGQTIVLADLGALDLRAVDIDGDGDTDISLSQYRPSALQSTVVWINQLSTSTASELVSVFTDVNALGVGGYADLDGDGDLDAFDISSSQSVVAAENGLVPRTGAVFCEQPNANSSGESGRIDAYGVPAAGGAPLRLVASRLPVNTFGFFIGSPNTASPVLLSGSAGFLCLGAGLGRYSRPAEIGATGPAGAIEVTVAPDDLRTGSTAVTATAGLTWSFQAWHRDITGSGTLSNLTDGVTVTYQ